MDGRLTLLLGHLAIPLGVDLRSEGAVIPSET
jgi:hypothetical protein